MTDEEIEQAEEELHDLFEDVRDALAEDIGAEPEDHRADRRVTDGGDE